MSTDAEFQAFLAEGATALRRYAYVLTRDMDRAQDLTQDTLVRVYEARRRIEPGTYHAYARRTMYNLNVSWWRRLTNREERLPDDAETRAPFPDGADERADREALLTQVRQLPLRTRTALVLYYYEDYTTAQIAEVLDISEPGVRTLLSRGRAALRTHLEPSYANGVRHE